MTFKAQHRKYDDKAKALNTEEKEKALYRRKPK